MATLSVLYAHAPRQRLLHLLQPSKVAECGTGISHKVQVALLLACGPMIYDHQGISELWAPPAQAQEESKVLPLRLQTLWCASPFIYLLTFLPFWGMPTVFLVAV